MLRTSLLGAIVPKYQAPLDPNFRPSFLGNLAYEEAVHKSANRSRVVIGIEREEGFCSRCEFEVPAPESCHAADTLHYVERLVKFLLWARGGWRLYFAGPAKIGSYLAASYAAGAARSFDVQLMAQAYGRPFEVKLCKPEEVPQECGSAVKTGGFFEGCRIGFDLGASDYKVAAVSAGKVVFSSEFPWNPKDAADPEYHYNCLRAGIKKAAEHLPRIDAIGGSSAGIIVANQPMVASLFRSVPTDLFETQIKPIFSRLGAEFGAPVMVLNDGDVTALAGAITLKANAVLGIAMGSSQAGGYVDPDGRITGWINELAFAPIDYNPEAASDEWSKDRGVGALYFSQQAVGKLLPAARLNVSPQLGLPEQLAAVQNLAEQGSESALLIYETIGTYLGYTLPLYARYYQFSHLLLLGRVLTGRGGNLIVERAGAILKSEFPDLAARFQIHTPDEKSKRVGQAVAAASLPPPAAL